MSDVPTFEVVVERHNRRATVESIAATREAALLDAVKAYATVDVCTVGGVEVRHNDSRYSVVGFAHRPEDEDAYVEKVEQEGVLKSGGMVVTVQR